MGNESIQSSQFTYIDFVKLALPVAIGVLVSAQIAALISDMQKDLISPLLGIAFNGDTAIGSLQYKYSDTITFSYGHFLNRILATLITLLIAYLGTRFLLRFGVDARRRI